ncbi:hypothetical protein [Pseudoroseicyclus aestuarii]|uniref:Muramidase (Phage lysozyme) n=1 Tax=Pseudoroseicyclus aestuarii TaxID=1795041 RepID=A0A318SRN0_9RHOB|nr:hypothetical protein [Pseudoroseicyclus aestuarii]PYE80892.1 hypothetical protein DFP88_10923 [Pseudoroseicyclus aestuarii]
MRRPPLPALVPMLAAMLLLPLAGGAGAQGYSLLGNGGLAPARQPLIAVSAGAAAPQPLIRARAQRPDTAAAEAARAAAQSLFIGRAAGGLFAAPDAGGRSAYHGGPLGDDPEATMIRHLIAQAEAGPEGYDAVQYGARRKPGRPPTQMTLAEIYAWIEATPGQPHAIGRYQFIPATLRRLVEMAGAQGGDRFSPQLQDRLADILLHEAGLARFRAGTLSRHGLMNNLAKIWAGLPNSSGRSHYDGYAGNSATMSWASFDREMARILEG